MSANYKKLDNPAWHALTESHAAFAEGTDAMKRYYPDIVLFAGYDLQEKDIEKKFDEVFEPGDSFFLFDEYPALPSNYQLETVVQCLQMVCERPAAVSLTEPILPLNETNWEEMYLLVSQVFPVITCRARQ